MIVCDPVEKLLGDVAGVVPNKTPSIYMLASEGEEVMERKPVVGSGEVCVLRLMETVPYAWRLES
jgi:hypothetical protein